MSIELPVSVPSVVKLWFVSSPPPMYDGLAIQTWDGFPSTPTSNPTPQPIARLDGNEEITSPVLIVGTFLGAFGMAGM